MWRKPARSSASVLRQSRHLSVLASSVAAFSSGVGSTIGKQ
ncbi:predicted protein [Botrytis cinerea T4]|uniref:Uncharacterized protein n=1 Tax=Botryotinia fuckeliana (strain T4) TaxID=999810 RepID=G2YVK5_BOTF4|nr:predicted protein [Botrytis cinerea T4]